MRMAKLPERIRLGACLLFYCQFSLSGPRTRPIESRWAPNEHVLCARSTQIEYLIIIIFSLHALHGRHFSIQYFARIHPQPTTHHTEEIKWTPKHVFYYPSTYTKYSNAILHIVRRFISTKMTKSGSEGERSGRDSSTFYLNNKLEAHSHKLLHYTTHRSCGLKIRPNAPQSRMRAEFCSRLLAVYAKHWTTSFK